MDFCSVGLVALPFTWLGSAAKKSFQLLVFLCLGCLFSFFRFVSFIAFFLHFRSLFPSSSSHSHRFTKTSSSNSFSTEALLGISFFLVFGS